MIDFDFTFLQPKTVKEAHEIYKKYHKDGRSVMFFGGGTEFISRARHGEIGPEVVIDVKCIPECQVYELKDGQLTIGAGTPLTTLTSQVYFPLLSDVVRGIATRTARNKITIGGNLCSHLPYKEAILPFLLAESKAVIATDKGLVERLIDGPLQLGGGEFLVQIVTDEKMLNLTCHYEKRTRQSRVNYPIVTMASMEVANDLHLAMSGLYEDPICLRGLGDLEAGEKDSLGKMLEKELKSISADVLEDEIATRAYRKFVYQTLLQQMLTKKEGAS